MHTTGSIAASLGAKLIGPPDIEVKRLDSLHRAGPGELTFIRDGQNARLWKEAKASAALVSTGLDVDGHDAGAKALIIVPDADLALASTLELFAPPPIPRAPGIHPNAIVHQEARIDPTAHVGPFCIIDRHASVGPGSVLVSGVTLGPGASIGAKTTLHPGVTILERCVVGSACILHAGVVVGADGFGYRLDPKAGVLVKIPHIGNVVIGNAVEIGANAAIDRAKFGSTTIGDGTKIDNLVQIAHNCTIGRCVILCGQVGIGGSVTIGDGAMLGGAASVRDNVTIGAMAQVAGRAGVVEDVPPASSVFGLPAIPGREAMRISAASRRLVEYFSRVRALERRVFGSSKPADSRHAAKRDQDE
ncbi:MAG: UDP-3-O-(3-hydroxymyristoyl)glucosamine N-acyltransferase [Phycisphaeraceae bacterium]|nr:UDP-3-O-(3-hydroxymyristoyl)glucosamine N-acyltransferase [Phycisphaeraceae bacterium]